MAFCEIRWTVLQMKIVILKKHFVCVVDALEMVKWSNTITWTIVFKYTLPQKIVFVMYVVLIYLC